MQRRITQALLPGAGAVLILLLSACAAPTAPSTPVTPAPTPVPTHTLDVNGWHLTTDGNRNGIAAWVRSLRDATDVAPVDATLTVSPGGAITSVSARTGRELDVDASVDRILAALADETESSTELVVRSVPPAITDAMLQPTRARIEHLLLYPPALTFENQRLPLLPEDVAPMLRVRGTELEIEPGAAEAFAWLMAAEFHRDSVDARLTWKGNGNLEVLRPSEIGRDLEVEVTAERVTQALLAGAPNIEMPVYAVAPAVSSQDLEALGITELIERASTSFAGSVPEKKHNIKLAAERLNGIVVAPGATFSFNREVGPTTIDAGFQWGFAITGSKDGPRTVPSVGGGICQVATTLFQPVFWAGYQLEERRTHSYWIPAYASRGLPGLDVTVDADSNMDFRWTNTTENYALIQSSVSGDTVEFALYGKKPSWRVDVSTAEVSNTRPADPTPVTEEEPALPSGKSVQVSSAGDGFDVQITRVVTPLDGPSEPRQLRVRASYQPSRAVTLLGTGSSV